jgi:4-hydroxy-2-oxoheptanedioate aldolase
MTKSARPRLRQAWDAGRPAIGAWLSSDAPMNAEALSDLDVDYIAVDLQHGVVDYAGAVRVFQSLQAAEATLVCRVPWNEPGIIGKVLDAGAMGVIVPMVNTADDARRAVAACRYAPDGARSFGPIRARRLFGADYAERANDEIACIPMIETAEALGNLDDILDVPGIDAAYVGPADLSLTLGLPPRSDHADPRFVDALVTIRDACEARGIVPGIHAVPGLGSTRLSEGFRMVTVTSDLTALAAGAAADVAAARP